MHGRQQAIDQDLRVFRELSLWLWDSHERPWAYKDADAQAIYQGIQYAYRSFNSPEELEAYLPNEEKVQSEFPPTKFLYLNPVEGQALVPIIWIGSDFGRSIPELRIRLGLFSAHAGNTKAIGFRFESPEGPGDHHYYHAQLISGFKPGDSFLGDKDWLPTRSPTLPLDADNPVKLMLSLLIALYGVLYLSKIRSHVYGLDLYMDSMHCNNTSLDLKCYRKVITKVERFHEVPDQDLDKFEISMKSKYPGCRIVPITKGNFDQYGSQSSKKLFKRLRGRK